MFDSSSSQLSSVLNWSQSSGEAVVDGLSVVVEFPISSCNDFKFMTMTMMIGGGVTKYDNEDGADDDDINDIGGNNYDDDYQAPLHDGRSACSPNAGPQWL